MTTKQHAPALDEKAIKKVYNATILKMKDMIDAGKNDMPTLWDFRKSLNVDQAVINEVFNRLQEKGYFHGMAGTCGSPTFYITERESFCDEVKRITALTSQHAHHENSQKVNEADPITSEQHTQHSHPTPVQETQQATTIKLSQVKDVKTAQRLLGLALSREEITAILNKCTRKILHKLVIAECIDPYQTFLKPPYTSLKLRK